MTTKAQINQFITENRRAFTQGNVITEQELCEWFSINKPKRNTVKAVQKYNLAKLTAYCRLNRYLSARGLVIRSVDYYSEFHIQPTDAVEAQADRLEKMGTDKIRNAQELRAGFTLGRAKWKKLTRAQLSRVRDYQADHLFSGVQ